MKYLLLRASVVLALILLLTPVSSFSQSNEEIMKTLNELKPVKENCADDCIIFSQEIVSTPVLGISSIGGLPSAPTGEGEQPDAPTGEGEQPDAPTGEGEQPDAPTSEDFTIEQQLLSDKTALIRGTRLAEVNGTKVKRLLIRTFEKQGGDWKITSWVEITK